MATKKLYLLTRIVHYRDEETRYPCAVFTTEENPPKQAVLESIPSCIQSLAREFCPDAYKDWIRAGDQNLQTLINVLIQVLPQETIKDLIYEYYDIEEVDFYET